MSSHRETRALLIVYTNGESALGRAVSLRWKEFSQKTPCLMAFGHLYCVSEAAVASASDTALREACVRQAPPDSLREANPPAALRTRHT